MPGSGCAVATNFVLPLSLMQTNASTVAPRRSSRLSSRFIAPFDSHSRCVFLPRVTAMATSANPSESRSLNGISYSSDAFNGITSRFTGRSARASRCCTCAHSPRSRIDRFSVVRRDDPGSEREVQWFGAVPQPLGVSYCFPGDPVKVPFEQQYGVWDNYEKVVLR